MIINAKREYRRSYRFMLKMGSTLQKYREICKTHQIINYMDALLGCTKLHFIRIDRFVLVIGMPGYEHVRDGQPHRASIF